MLFLTGLLLSAFQTFSQTKSITLEDVWYSRDFYPYGVYGYESMKDGKTYCRLVREKGDVSLKLYEYEKEDPVKTILKEGELLLPGSDASVQIDEYQFSHNEELLLIASETEGIYRRSSESKYYIYDIKNKKLSQLTDKGKVRLATFSPDDHYIAFVKDNNIFIKDIQQNTETQITKDGEKNKVINGASDWVYEEEFAFSKAFFWSPDSKKIAFYRFDESKVKQYILTYYETLYPEWYEFKYPKAGEDNSVVDIFVHNIPEKKSVKMDIGTETDQYIPRIKWTASAQTLAIQRMNRLQNKLEILFADANSGASEVVYSENDKYYIDITDDLTFLKDGEHFVITSEKDGYNHIYLYKTDGSFVRQITKGKWDVTTFIGVDEKKGLVYYISAEESPLRRSLYVIDLEGKKKTKLSKQEGTNKADFSENFHYYINTYSNANTPGYITLHKSNGKEIRVLQDNKRVVNKMKEYGFSTKEFFSFTTSENIKLNGYMIKPPDFDIKKRYPVLMFVYGGPGSQTVLDSWDYGYYTYFQFLAQQGFIVASVDNRGTGSRGAEFKKCTYLQLGNLETIDQTEAAKHFQSLPYVDPEKIGIFGWSYGGFMAASCLSRSADVFSTAVSVAPVTNWRYYDNIYTERFMRTPMENPDGYDDNSPINHVEKIKGNLLLVHGLTDDNVHFQNAAEFAKRLIEENIPFDMAFYPNKNHGIYGGKTRLHLFNQITEFLEENLK